MSVYGSFADAGFALLTNIDDITTLWADVDGTIPASLNGRVKRIDDVSGNGRYLLLENTSYDGWVLKVDENGRHYLENASSANTRMMVNGDPLLSGLRSFLIAYFVYPGQDSAPYMPFVGDTTNYPFHGSGGTAIIDATYAAASVSGGAWHKNGSAINPADTGTQPRDVPSAVTCVTTSALAMNVRYWRDRNFARNIVGRVYDIAISTSAWSAGDIAAIHTVALTNYTGGTTYTVTPDVTSAAEGDIVTYTATGPDGTYYYRISDSGTAGAADIVGSSIGTGEVVISGGTGEFEITIRADLNTEGAETLIIELHDTKTGSPTLLATAATVTINDTSTSADHSWSGTTYVVGIEVVGETGSAAEGNTVTVQITATPPPPAGSRLAMSVTGTVDNSDYSIIGSSDWIEFDGVETTLSWGITLDEDVTTEGAETLQIVARTGWPASDGDIIYTSPTITVGDTSQAAPTYAAAISPLSADEGDTITVTLDCTTVAPGTDIWANLTAASTITAADIVGNVDAWQFEIITGDIISSQGSFNFDIAADVFTDYNPALEIHSTVTSATATTITDTSQAWAVDEHAGKLWVAESGTGTAENIRSVIVSNTSDTLTLADSLAVTPDATTGYGIYPEWLAIELRTGSAIGDVVETTLPVPVSDTSITAPSFSISQNKTLIGEGGAGVQFTVTANYFLGSTLYGTISGTASDADFNETLPVTISMAETTWPEKVGTVSLSASLDALLEGPESFVFNVRTESAAGTIVATSDPVEISDEQWTVIANKGVVKEGESILFAVVGVNAADGTYYYNTVGNVADVDFTDDSLTGEVVISGGIGTITRTLKDDLLQEGGEYFYITLHRTSPAGQQLASSSAAIIQESIINFDSWLSSADGVRVLLINLYHSDGVERISNYPYVSYPSDTTANTSFEAILKEAVNITQRIDGGLSVGKISVVNDGSKNDWLDYHWTGYNIEMLLGEPGWSLDDFRIVAKVVNGGINDAANGHIAFAIFDAKAGLNEPLQTTLLADGRPAPLVYGAPFNVTPALIDQPNHGYKVHDGTISSVEVRSNGAVVSTTNDLANGEFELNNNELGTIACDPVSPLQTPAVIISALATQYGYTVDSATTAALPTWVLGLYYASAGVTGAQVMQNICDSIKGYWHIDTLGQIKVYQLAAPTGSEDFELTPDDIEAGGLELVAKEPPYKTVTLRYNRNWSPASRDSLAGILDTDGAFAETLVQEWSQVTATNTLPDHPKAGHLVIDTYLTSETDAQTLCDLIASLWSQTRYRYKVAALMSSAQSTVGQEVLIRYPGQGFEAGKNARVVAVDRNLSKFRVGLEVWL